MTKTTTTTPPTDRTARPDFVPSGFFVLRTPLLPFDELVAWSEGLSSAVPSRDALARERAALRARLRAVIERPEVLEALYLAAPGLCARLPDWLEATGETERALKVERALVRYLARMAGRPTPFGLFSGCALGRVEGEATRLVLAAPRAEYRRHTQLEVDCHWALAAALAEQPELRERVAFRANPTGYLAADQWRYLEARRLDDGHQVLDQVAIDATTALRRVLDATFAAPCTRPALVAALASRPLDAGALDAPAAREFVDALVENQVLLPADLEPGATGDHHARALAQSLARLAPQSAATARLREVAAALESLDAAGPGAPPARYAALAASVAPLGAPVDPARLVRVALATPARDAVLGRAVVADIAAGIEALRRLGVAAGHDRLARFREAFSRRYELREVPLLEALDPDLGIGFDEAGQPDDDALAVLAGMPQPAATEPLERRRAGALSPPLRWGPREALLLRAFERAARTGAREIALGPADIADLPRDPFAPLPDAFAVLATVLAADEPAIARGEYRVVVSGLEGPSGARALGRFCHAVPGLTEAVRAHLRAEEALRPELAFAEIAHLPPGRGADLVVRPVLRDREIAWMGRPGVPDDAQIPVRELRVSVRSGRVVLRAPARLGEREVAPRLTAAHATDDPAHDAVYRFLGAVQSQGVASVLAWDWGPLREARALPRVVYGGRVVLAPARFRASGEDLARLAAAAGFDDAHARADAVRRLRAELGLPRWVCLAEGLDQLLPLDLDNSLCADALAHAARAAHASGAAVVLLELAGGPEGQCARGPEGRFRHELVVPFVREPASGSARAPAARPQRAAAPEPSVRPVYPPGGSEWLYARVYTGAGTADRVLLGAVAPLVARARREGALADWFFVRYGDPDWHLRVRLRGAPAALREAVLPALHRALEPLRRAGTVWRVQLDTYEPEVERYGGTAAVALAEQVHGADSDAALALLAACEGGDEARLRLAVASTDALLAALGLDAAAKAAVVGALREQFGRELGADGAFRKALGARFRLERAELEQGLAAVARAHAPRGSAHASPPPWAAAIARRTARVAPAAAALRALEQTGGLAVTIADFAASCVHMQANRLFPVAARAQELRVYDALARLYDAHRARGGRPAR